MRRRGVAVMLAIGVQGALWMLLTPPPPARIDGPTPSRITLRVVAAALPPRAATAPPADTPRQGGDRPASPRARVAPAEAAAPVETLPAAPEPAATPASPRLNLALPGRDLIPRSSPATELRTAALNDPRANTVKPRLDERLALATGQAPCLLSVLLPDGRIERRFGRLVYLETLHAAATGRKDLVAMCVE